jgi:hypothetical protein
MQPNGKSGLKPSAARVLAICLTVNLLASLLAAVMGYHAGNVEKHFLEHRFITYLSFAQLLLVAWLALRVFVNRAEGGFSWRAPQAVWLLVALGFVFLAADELAVLHEWMDHRIHDLMGMAETGITDRIDDLIIVAYGLAGVGVLCAYRREIRRFDGAMPYVAGGFAFLVLMVAFDIVSNRPDLVPYPNLLPSLGAAEDTLKLVTECFLIAAAYRCTIIAGGLSPLSTHTT